MTDIIIQGSQAFIPTLDKDTNTRLENLFSYDVKGAEFSEAYKTHKWDGVQYVFKNKRFPVGLLESVLKQLPESTIIDNRKLGEHNEQIPKPKSQILRDYQLKAVELALTSRISNFQGRMASMQLSTGAGKSYVIGELIARLNYKTLVLVPSVEILRQIQSVLTDYLSVKVGIIGDNQFEAEDITVSTWQSLNSKSYDYTELLTETDVLIVDESQHLGAPILRDISHKIPSIFRFSCSGTSFREDNASLYIEATTGPIVYSIGYSQLINQGYLVQPHIRILRFPNKTYHSYDTYHDIYTNYIVNNEFRNQYIIKIANELINQNRKVLIFVSRVSHGEELVKLGGHDFLYASNPDRRQLIDGFKSGEIKCLISTSVLQEGFDLPAIDSMILASPSKSMITTVQRIGRSLRPFEGKHDTIIYDTYDDCRYLNKASQR
ncbi:MAG: DEAD/DEAH box helicase, partial [Thermoplasmata archaeon]